MTSLNYSEPTLSDSYSPTCFITLVLKCENSLWKINNQKALLNWEIKKDLCGYKPIFRMQF